ncbi:four helix bundle protein [bacterium]|nr:four helix bundle protein [bacterium]
MKESQFDLENRLIDFSVRIVRLVEFLPESKTGNHIRGQLLRCGTAASPNYAEGRDAESRADFIHKLKIVLKELRETKVWLTLILRAEIVSPNNRLDPLLQECDELISIFVKSVKTAKLKSNIKQ